MKTKKSFALCAVAIATTLLSSCGNVNPPAAGTDELKGELSTSLTLEAGKTYKLNGGFHVKNGAVLNIKEGVTIKAVDDDVVDYILIEQGGKILAEGTSDAPIIMTSSLATHGSWGGIHICGYAPINVTGTAKSEVGDAVYGGNNPADNSGVLRYVRVEYAGYSFSEEKEANGFTFYGVGNGTVLEYCQAYKGSDDGFEWFGGTVNGKYLMSTDNTDDSFDWTQGWTGHVQFMVANQLTSECDCLMECDNNSKNPDASPASFPTLSNITLVGNNSSENTKGIRLRAGTKAKIYNALVLGKEKGLIIETTQTDASFKSGESKLNSIMLASAMINEAKDAYVPTYTVSDFEADGNKQNAQITLTNTYVGTVTDGATPTTSLSSHFVAADYIGAVEQSNNWTLGWSK